MIARASSVLLLAYFIIVGSGVIFLTAASPSLVSIAAYQATLTLWATFYIVGGLTASAALIARKFTEKTAPLWYFEVAGMSLIIAANIMYTFALINTAQISGENHIYAVGLLLLGFSASLTGRAIEALRLVKVLNQFSNKEF